MELQGRNNGDSTGGGLAAAASVHPPIASGLAPCPVASGNPVFQAIATR